jgi:DNA recombination protein RmuC
MEPLSNPVWIVGALLGLILIGLVVWVLVQNTQDQKKNEAMEAQMNELRRDLLGLSTSQAQSAGKMEIIANAVAARLEAVTSAVQQGAKDSAEITSQITAQAQTAMSNELKNTREQITQIQQQLGQVQESGHLMHEAASRLENILGGTKSRGNFGETTLERLLEDCLPRTQYTQQYRFRSGEAADAVIHLRDKKIMVIDSKFPLDAFQRLETEGDEARKTFVNAVKLHADSIAKKYIVPDEDTLDLALMFVPSEAVYYELLRSTDARGVAADAYCRTKKIIPVSPNTLYAHLSVIAMGLRGMQIEENAKRLSANLAGMRKQLDTFSESFDKIGTHLKNAQLSYAEADKRLDKASGSLDNLLTNGELNTPINEAQGTLALPPVATAAKKSA